MQLASLRRHRDSLRTSQLRSVSPFTFLDDPFSSRLSSLLFFSTLALAAALVFCLMRHHLRRARTYVGGCPECERVRREMSAATTGVLPQEALRLKIHDEDIAKGQSSAYSWPLSSKKHSDLERGASFGPKDEHRYSVETSLPCPRSFYTLPSPSRRQYSPSHRHPDVFCPAHDTGGSFTATGCSADDELEQDRKEQSGNTRQPPWPAALQGVVVVGDVKESGIAKRRLTVTRGE